MDIQHGLTRRQELAANVARNWTTDSACLARLACEYCFADAENSAVENGAPEENTEAWAAQYLSQGDSTGCHRHNGS